MNWNLQKYYYRGIEDKQLMIDFNQAIDNLEKIIKKYEPILKVGNKEDYISYLIDCSKCNLFSKVYRYLYLLSDINVDNTEIQSLTAKLDKIYFDTIQKTLYVEEANKIIGYNKFIEWSDLDLFKDYKKHLIDIANNLKYQLSEKEEIVGIKINQANSNSMFGEYSNSLEFEIDGEKKTQEEVRALRVSSNEETRKKAFIELAKVFNDKKSKIVFSNLYSVVCKQSVSEVELRKYETIMSSRNIGEDVSNECVDNLLKEVKSNYNLYHQFLKIKAKLLGKDILNTWDIPASINLKGSDEKMTFDEGFNFYLNTIKNIDILLHDYSIDMLKDGRLDVKPHSNKRGGAYASYGKGFKSFSLLNWTDTIDDVSTLAHELGHCFHGHLSQKQNYYNYHTPMITAETASIFNETIMFGAILNKVDKNGRIKLIVDRLDDIFSTIFRQVAYVSFERKCHESFLNNNPLTWKKYDELWLSEMKELYGDSVKIDDDMIKYGWSSIPHIFDTPFYCYAYSFGNITALNIYQNYENSDDKKEFIKKYHNFLSSGSIDIPEKLLKDNFGFDFKDPNFFKIGFEHIKNLISQIS